MTQPLHPGAHPDADQINTFVEGAASEHQREQMLMHLAECDECRELVFLLQSPVEPEPREASSAIERPGRRWFLPLGLVGAALACGITALVYVRVSRQPSAQPSQTAVVTAPPQEAPATIPPSPSRPAPVPWDLPKRAVRPSSGAAVGTSNGAAGGASNAIERSEPAPPLEAAAPAAKPAEQAQADANQPSAKSESAKEAPVPVTGRNFAILAGLAPAPALRIEHDHGPDDGRSAVAGRVTDASGAVIAGAQVVLRDSPGATRQTTTDLDGRFSLAEVAPGHYSLTVTAKGFERAQQAIDLQARDLARLETVLPIGAESQTVTVQAENNLQTQQTQQSDAAIAIAEELPSRMPATERVANGKRVLSIDAEGTLFLSRNAGKSWKKVKPAWSGKVVGLALVDQASVENAEKEVKRKRSTQGAPQVFQITTESGAAWISDDGAHWRSH